MAYIETNFLQVLGDEVSGMKYRGYNIVLFSQVCSVIYFYICEIKTTHSDILDLANLGRRLEICHRIKYN